MGKRRAKHPFEDNPFIDGFLEWMDAPEGQQSIEALDLVFGALEHAGVDARQRKIVWADGKRLSIEQSTDRIHAGHPGVPRHLIETHVLGWLENCAPESYSERQLEELDRLIGPWLDDYAHVTSRKRVAENSALPSHKSNRRKFRQIGFRPAERPTSGNFPVLNGWWGAIQ
jgi:hypothetical protein